MGEYSARKTALEQSYGQYLQQIESQKQSELSQVEQWYNSAQQTLKSQRTSLGAEKSQQMLDFALQRVREVEAQTNQRTAILQQWASANAKTLGQLSGYLNQIGQNTPTFQGNLNTGINSNQQNNGLYGYRNQNAEDQTNIFQQ